MTFTLHFLEHAISIAKNHNLRFKNMTKLAEFCCEYVSSMRENKSKPSISTLTRNPVYRALLENYIEAQDIGNKEIEIRQLKLANSNLRHDVKRLKSYIETIEEKQAGLIVETSKTVGGSIDLEKSNLVKTIDLLVDHFSEHIEIDLKAATLVCPFRKSSERIIVPKRWAQTYILIKSIPSRSAP